MSRSLILFVPPAFLFPLVSFALFFLCTLPPHLYCPPFETSLSICHGYVAESCRYNRGHSHVTGSCRLYNGMTLTVCPSFKHWMI
ncbi:hypothetical protein K443DRAFT_237797 [Laccaria amethystina LaAM-08-1]|uniref:Uncharacterized protein n=1 Tax=Laccaria amethystina LaAM-08-1 TaxID=1095629 RepID=A0A0C9WY16_9AGAR|nr:hypothetical protein K443DRAFT_237797 [Laccaria amethystina LaAM-08-1]